jgi:hypothetical protein
LVFNDNLNKFQNIDKSEKFKKENKIRNIIPKVEFELDNRISSEHFGQSFN